VPSLKYVVCGCLGMLTALCDGPTRPAICDLKNRQDDTFVLVIVPQETGRHVVSVKYANEHVPGTQ
jgi:filamin